MAKLRNPSIISNLKAWFTAMHYINNKYDFSRRLVSPHNKHNDGNSPWNDCFFSLEGFCRYRGNYFNVIIPFEKLSPFTQKMIWDDIEAYD